MQTIHKDENEGGGSKRTDPVGTIICARRVSGHLEGECLGRFGRRRIRIRICEGVIKKEFRGGKKESVKVIELKRLEQGGRTMEEFVQEFRRAARGSGYEGRPLVEEFKKGINGVIRRKLMEAERPPTSIEQWYKCATNLDRH